MMILYVREGALDMCSSCTALHDGGSEGSKSCFVSELKQLATFPPSVPTSPRNGLDTGGALLGSFVECCR